MAETGPIIGIDFGTTKCVAAIVDGQTPRPIIDRHGHAHIPSLVLVSPDGELAVGWEAQNHRRRYETEYITINSIKRAVGRQGESGWAWWKTRPQEVAALILGRLKLEVEASLGHAVTKAVIAIPAHFNINQRWAVKQAAEIAGFDVVRLLNEATAAGLRYGLRSTARPGYDDTEKLLVFDFGGGTLDVSVLEIADRQGVYEVKAIAGDGQLGGDDFDQVIIDFIRDQLRKTAGASVEFTTGRNTVLREAAIRAKIDLSSSTQARIHLPGFLSASQGIRHDVDIRITAEHFRSLSSNLLARVTPVVDRALADAYLRPEQVSTVLVTGGASRMPEVQHVLRKVFGSATYIGAYGDSVVAEGAAIQAAVLRGTMKRVLLLDVCSASLGIETLGGATTVLIPRNTTIPTKRTEIFSTTQDNQDTVVVRAVQGERKLARENELVGKLELTGIRPGPRGAAPITVTFEIDANGVEQVTALDTATGRQEHLQLVSSFRLSPTQMRAIQQAVASQLRKFGSPATERQPDE